MVFKSRNELPSIVQQKLLDVYNRQKKRAKFESNLDSLVVGGDVLVGETSSKEELCQSILNYNKRRRLDNEVQIIFEGERYIIFR